MTKSNQNSEKCTTVFFFTISIPNLHNSYVRYHTTAKTRDMTTNRTAALECKSLGYAILGHHAT